MSATAPAVSLTEAIAAAGVDPDWAARSEARMLATQRGAAGYLPIHAGAALTPAQEEALPVSNLYDEWHSHERTLLNGLRGAAAHANTRDDVAPCIRANMGVGISATSFGCVQTVFADKMPWITQHVALADLETFDAANAPFGADVDLALERTRYLAAALAGSGITPFCFDTQGPFDLAHLVIGDEIFYAMYDEPERVHRLLDDCVTMLIRHIRAYKEAAGEPRTGGRHSGALAMPGGIRVCEDTPTLLNEAQIHAFVVPYTRKLLQHFGGGWIHYCGRNDHLYDAVLRRIPECVTFNFGNPDMHDMAQVLADALEAGKTYCGGIPRHEDESEAAYLERVLGYTQGARRGLILQCGSGETAVPRWRALQGVDPV